MKKIRWMIVLKAMLAVLSISRSGAQQNQVQKPTQDQKAPAKSDMPGMDMSEMQHDDGPNSQAAAANDEMSDMHMGMGPHMRMTDLRKPQPGDEQRAEQILEKLRPTMEEYKDYHNDLEDGFKIFGPRVPQDIYHFTNYRYEIGRASC